MPTAGSAVPGLVVVVGAHLVLLALVLFTASRYSPAGRLLGLDVLALPGERVVLGARLEFDGPAVFHRDPQGLTVEFFEAGAHDDLPACGDDGWTLVRGRSVGRAVTARDGSVELETAAPTAPGNHFFAVVPVDEEGIAFDEQESYLVVLVSGRDDPIIISDLDSAITRGPPRATDVQRYEDLQPREGARVVLAEQSQTHGIVYLASWPTWLGSRTRRWLSKFSFPAGPVFFGDFSDADFKGMFIRDRITSRWEGAKTAEVEY